MHCRFGSGGSGGSVGGVEMVGHLKPQIGHNIGFKAPISTRSAWAPSRACHTARVKWCGAEKCAKFGPKIMSKLPHGLVGRHELDPVASGEQGRRVLRRIEEELCSLADQMPENVDRMFTHGKAES